MYSTLNLTKKQGTTHGYDVKRLPTATEGLQNENSPREVLRFSTTRRQMFLGLERTCREVWNRNLERGISFRKICIGWSKSQLQQLNLRSCTRWDERAWPEAVVLVVFACGFFVSIDFWLENEHRNMILRFWHDKTNRNENPYGIYARYYKGINS